MTYVWLDDNEQWGMAKDLFIVEVSDNELEKLEEDPAYWHHKWLENRRCLIIREGTVVHTNMPEYPE